MGEWLTGICSVCQTLDNDIRPKKVQYCDFCGANICDRDLYSTRRVKAFMTKKNLSLEGLKTWLAAQRA